MCRDSERPTVGTTKGRDCWLVFLGEIKKGRQPWCSLVFSFWYGVELSLVAIMRCQTLPLPLPQHLKANMDIDSRRNETAVAFKSMRCNYATPHLYQVKCPVLFYPGETFSFLSWSSRGVFLWSSVGDLRFGQWVSRSNFCLQPGFICQGNQTDD